jgi:ComF family protein
MLRDFISLLYPQTCALCNEGLSRSEKQICLQCLHRLPRYVQELDQEGIFLHFIQSYRYEAFYAYLKYYKKGITQQLLHQIKYNRMPVLAEMMGYMLGSEIKKDREDKQFDLILPVPLHPKKKKKRGYNQSDYFARGLARALKTNWSDREIKRIKNTETQTHKSRMERIENVRGIFKINDPIKLQGKHILLVDDVITTGATLESCSDSILQEVDCKLSLAAMAIAK